MQLDTDKILATAAAGIGTLVFNHPEKRNALSLEMWKGIGDALAAFNADTEIRLVVMRGAGGKAFISGADISQFEERRSSADTAAEYNAITERAWSGLSGLGKPLIAAIEGFCLGGGLAVAMKADIRITTKSAIFGIPAARLGLAYPTDSVRDLVALVGPSEAKRILFTGTQFDSAAALRIGLINDVVEDGGLDAAIAALASILTDNAPLSMRAAKETVDQIARGRMDMARLNELATICITSEDYAEGRRAFMEKRRPRFRGR
jgi:enoyl-CoA hydratase/carnithine racemase